MASEKKYGKPKIHFYTAGVYGISEKEFFNKLMANQIDTFCDIRRRRAVRGPLYSFVNSKRLQDKLLQLGINYLYEIDLSPTNAIRELQKKADELNKIQTRKREVLDPAFRSEYIRKIISRFDFDSFVDRLKKMEAKRVLFFCVEKSPWACHRSLVASKLKEMYPAVQVIHL